MSDDKHERIRRRAYEIWEREGQTHWLAKSAGLPVWSAMRRLIISLCFVIAVAAITSLWSQAVAIVLIAAVVGFVILHTNFPDVRDDDGCDDYDTTRL
ncbi:MAG: DUF2934 domain-containing protein [Mesorhizobium sp.]|nr:MAG: DUF2934 domain-containing protein [Mesorhizobium sp.]